MRYCTSCGAPLRPGATFCTSCGTAVEGAGQGGAAIDAESAPTRVASAKSVLSAAPHSPVFPRTPPTASLPPPPPPPPPPPSLAPTQIHSAPIPPLPVGPPRGTEPIGRQASTNWPLLVGVVVVVLALAGTIVALVLTRKSGTSASNNLLPVSNPTITSQPAADTPPPDTETTAPAPVQPRSASYGTVTYTAVRNNWRARQIAHTFDWYFSSINEADYSRAAEALSDHEAPNDPTTFDSQIVIQSLYRSGGVLLAEITFRSTQAPRWAPDHASRCLDWDLTFPIQRSYNFLPYQLGRPLPSDPPFSCG